MIREITRVQSTNYTLVIPESYVNRDLEILVFPIDEQTDASKINTINFNTINETAGLLSNSIENPVEWQRKIRSEWGRDE